MIGDLENCNVLGDRLCTTHNQDGRLCRKQAVDEWDRLRLELEEKKLQISEVVKALDCHPAYILETIQQLKEQRDTRDADTEQQLANANRLVGLLKNALEGFIDEECHCKEPGVEAPCVQCVARAAIQGKSLKRVVPVTNGNDWCSNCGADLGKGEGRSFKTCAFCS